MLPFRKMRWLFGNIECHLGGNNLAGWNLVLFEGVGKPAIKDIVYHDEKLSEI